MCDLALPAKYAIRPCRPDGANCFCCSPLEHGFARSACRRISPREPVYRLSHPQPALLLPPQSDDRQLLIQHHIVIGQNRWSRLTARRSFTWPVRPSGNAPIVTLASAGRSWPATQIAAFTVEDFRRRLGRAWRRRRCRRGKPAAVPVGFAAQADIGDGQAEFEADQVPAFGHRHVAARCRRSPPLYSSKQAC